MKIVDLHLNTMRQLKKISKATFDHHVNLPSFNDGVLVLAYDTAHDTLNHMKFKPL